MRESDESRQAIECEGGSFARVLNVAYSIGDLRQGKRVPQRCDVKLAPGKIIPFQPCSVAFVIAAWRPLSASSSTRSGRRFLRCARLPSERISACRTNSATRRIRRLSDSQMCRSSLWSLSVSSDRPDAVPWLQGLICALHLQSLDERVHGVPDRHRTFSDLNGADAWPDRSSAVGWRLHPGGRQVRRGRSLVHSPGSCIFVGHIHLHYSRH